MTFIVLRGWVIFFCPERFGDFFCPKRLGGFFLVPRRWVIFLLSRDVEAVDVSVGKIF